MLSVKRNELAGNIAGVLHIGIQGPPGKDGSSTTISLRYGISSEPMENTVVVWQDTIPQMSETYPYLWIEISTETKTSTGGSIVIEKGIIGYYSTPDSGGNADLTPELKTALVDYYTHVMPNFDDANGLAYINAILTALGAETREEPEEPDEPVVPDEPDEPDEPDTPVVTLSSISATYNGGDVAVGTAVSSLTGIVVTAHYSNGTSEAVTGYTLSGTIAEGSNTVTVSYGGKTATFSVTGVAESGGDGGVEVAMSEPANYPSGTHLTIYSDNGETSLYSVANGVYQVSEKTFDTDTEVEIQFTYSGTLSGRKLYVASYNGTTSYYGVELGTVGTSPSGTYTVKAGHQLIVVQQSNTASQGVATVTEV